MCTHLRVYIVYYSVYKMNIVHGLSGWHVRHRRRNIVWLGCVCECVNAHAAAQIEIAFDNNNLTCLASISCAVQRFVPMNLATNEIEAFLYIRLTLTRSDSSR